jgi:hypothetical protein
LKKYGVFLTETTEEDNVKDSKEVRFPEKPMIKFIPVKYVMLELMIERISMKFPSFTDELCKIKV